jgi:hypothetical protein
MSLRSLLTDLKDSAKKTFGGVDTAGSLSNKFWQSKAADNLSSWQKLFDEDKGKEFVSSFKRTPTNNRQRLGNSLIDIAGNMTAMGTEGGYQLKKGFQTKDKNLIGKGLIKSGTALLTARGAGMPLQVAAYSALPGAISGVGNYIKTKDTKQALNAGIGGAIDFLPKALPMTAIGSITNPLINKIGVGKNFAQRNALKAVPNVIEGIAMDKATGMETTPQSMLIDALYPALIDLGGMTFKSANDARIKAKYKIDETLGTGARKNGKYASLDQLLGKKGKGKTQALGLMAGVEPYQDEQGKWRVRFNKSKALIGLGVAYGGTKILKGAGDTAKGSDLEDILKAQNLKNNADDLISEARKYKSADKITNLNPTGGVFVEYTPKARVDAELGNNMTTVAKTLKKDPNTVVTIYRGVPEGVDKINAGDFVTTDIDYAKSWGTNIVSKKVKLGDLLDDIEEPSKGFDSIYRPNVSKELEGKAYDYTNSDWYRNYTDYLIKNKDKFSTLDDWIASNKASGKTKSQLTDIWNQANKVGGVGVKEQVQGLDSQKVGKTQYTQQPLQETALPKSSEFPYKDSISQQKLLPEGKPKVYTPNQAKAIFKRSGKQVPYKTTLKSGDSVINVPTGGWTGKKPYIEGKPITESEAFKISQWEKDVGTKAYKKGIVVENFPSKALSSDNVRDKSALSYQTETILRNTEETFGRGTKETDSVKKYFLEPTTKNETKRTWFVDNWKKDITTKFKNLGVTKRGSVEDMAAADFIEGNITKEGLLTKFKGNTKKVDNIIEAAEIGRKEYKTLLKRINDTITPYGYKPIAEKQNYVTHTKQISELTNKFGSLLNIPKDKLPTEMAAIHMDTKPGRQFFKFGQQRVGGSTHEGIITALDSYIGPASNQIYHTGDIQRGRAIVDYISKSSNGDTKLSNFNSYLSQYVDSLAGKKNVIDRPFEKVFGRQILNVGDWAKKRTGANMVGGNVSSALTNFIPFTESIATTSKPAVVKGLYEGLQSPFKAVDDIDGVKSEYLARNFLDKSSLFPKTGEKIIKKAGILFEAVDKFTKRSVVAGKYFENISKGLNPEDAMKSADEYAARALVDRSYGQTPIIFGSKTLGMFTQFQTEVNNQMSFLLKDIPKNLGYSKLQVASSLAQFAVLSYVFNNLYEKVTGRRPQIDVIHLVESYAQGLEEGKKPKDLLNPTDSNTPVGELISNLPFNPAGGRLPVGAAIPNLLDVASGKSTLKDEMKKPLYYIVPPVGGGQIKKTVEGLSAGNKGYSETKSGDMRFLVPENRKLQTAVFGQYSTPEAREYFDKNRRPLSDKQSSYVKQAGDRKSSYQEIVQSREKNAVETKIKDKVKKTGEMQTSDDAVFYFSGDEVKSVKKKISLPKLTSNNELNKQIISDYKSDLTDYANYIMYQYESGAISEDKAGDELEKIASIKKTLSNVTKTSKAKKVNISAISQKTLKPVKVQVKSPKFNTFEILNNYKKVKAPTIKAPDLKVIDFKTAKLKKGTK